jgi:dihydropteroate synthase
MRKQYLLPVKRHNSLKQLVLGEKTLLMGILNITPDSFSDGGRYLSPQAAIKHAEAMVAAGADIIDVGGESTRPGASPVTAQEELQRIVPIIRQLYQSLPVLISVDTYKAEVAIAALEAGATIINDISGLKFDPGLAQVVAKYQALLVLMHIRGTPQTMQQLPPSRDIWSEIITDLTTSITVALKAGVAKEQLIVDPGIGFGKTVSENLAIVAQLSRLAVLGLPILLGTSRKSFIGKLINRLESDRLWGTAATLTTGILQGAHIVRVHDVAPMREVAQISDALLSQAKG